MARQSALQDEIGQTRPFGTLREEAALGLLRTADVLRWRFALLFESRDLTAQQYNVLRILRGARPAALPTMEIADRMLEKTPGITRLIDKLERKGLVDRERSTEDRRCVHCSITDQGLAVLAELDEPVAYEDDRALEMLEPKELAQLIGLLDKIRAGAS